MFSHADILLQLARVPIFQGMTDKNLADILQCSQTHRVPKDCFFFIQGDPADNLFVLTEGRVKLCQMTLDGHKVIMKIALPWQMFGGLALVGKEVYPVCAMTAEDSSALAWTTAVLDTLLQRYPQMAINTTRWMGSHVKETQDLFTQISTERVEQRVARTLLRLIAQVGNKGKESVHLDFPLSRQDLAEMSGTTLYTVSRILSQWEKQGLVETGRKWVTVKQTHQLESIAEDLKKRE